MRHKQNVELEDAFSIYYQDCLRALRPESKQSATRFHNEPKIVYFRMARIFGDDQIKNFGDSDILMEK
ncbi:hypothetical protein TorRG33x02_325690 [Trema orientale]|uniref:Uncharacterized protein n=1 Tax=Trema orientale TaxID=63057 RepID=A0A2P5BCN0_TREOI|nr:hypothetical protein TorRG33x02_325690 [Trema orientale]